MAEIRVPAWPMPIHQTKLMMSKAHPTGTLLPQMPIPVKTRFVIVSIRIIVIEKAMAKPMNHQIGVLRLRTSELILSVTDAKSCPGSMSGAVSVLCMRTSSCG